MHYSPRLLTQVLWLLGVNHVATGLATYMNIALLDPIQKMGLQVMIRKGGIYDRLCFKS